MAQHSPISMGEFNSSAIDVSKNNPLLRDLEGPHKYSAKLLEMEAKEDGMGEEWKWRLKKWPLVGLAYYDEVQGQPSKSKSLAVERVSNEFMKAKLSRDHRTTFMSLCPEAPCQRMSHTSGQTGHWCMSLRTAFSLLQTRRTLICHTERSPSFETTDSWSRR